jgi:hypothetical protein
MVLTVSFALSLGTGLCCPHREQIVPLTWHQRRDARTSRLRRPRRDRSSARPSRAATQHVHRIPRSTFVTIAKRPSDECGTVCMMLVILVGVKLTSDNQKQIHCDKLARRAICACRACANCPSCKN